MISRVILLTTLTTAAFSQNLLPKFIFSSASIEETTGLEIAVGDPPPPVESCEDIDFCMRTREYRRDTEAQGTNADL